MAAPRGASQLRHLNLMGGPGPESAAEAGSEFLTQERLGNNQKLLGKNTFR